MFQCSTDDACGIMHLTVVGSATLDDFQEAMPGVLESLRSGRYPKLLVEIQHLNEGDNYVDPDLDFWTINEIKIWVTDVAIVCPKNLKAAVEHIVEVIHNHNKSVKIFDRTQDAVRWLKGSCSKL